MEGFALQRCAWAEGSELMRRYHDEEWGVPAHDDRLLFEHLILDGAQAGLSWETILKKRDNRRALLAVAEEFGSFDAYVWRFVGGKPRKNDWRSLQEIPPHTPESDAMSKDLKRRGFRFVGSTICYAFMQAAGLVNDHTVDCFRYDQAS